MLTRSLNDGHHARPRLWLVRLGDGGGHHLVDGFVGESCQLSHKLSMIQKVGSTENKQRSNDREGYSVSL